MTRSRYKFTEDQSPHFMTATVVAWLPIFSHPQFAGLVLDSWRFLQRERKIKILAFVIMENHLHWIAVGPRLSDCVRDFKSFTAKSIIKALKQCKYSTLLQELSFYKLRHKSGQTYQLWQEGNHPQQLDTDDKMWQKIEYVHQNPLRRGYVSDVVHWRYSSASGYAGMPCVLDVCTDWR